MEEVVKSVVKRASKLRQEGIKVTILLYRILFGPSELVFGVCDFLLLVLQDLS